MIKKVLIFMGLIISNQSFCDELEVTINCNDVNRSSKNLKKIIDLSRNELDIDEIQIILNDSHIDQECLEDLLMAYDVLDENAPVDGGGTVCH